MAFERILKPIYENGFNLPHEVGHHAWPSGYPLLSSLVSTELAAMATITLDKRYTYMQWVRFLDHDLHHMVPVLSMSHFSTGQPYSFVCTNDPSCFPIVIPHTDWHSGIHAAYMFFACSSPVYDISTTSLVMNSVYTWEWINQLTVFIDASNIYGRSVKESHVLRDHSEPWGLLRVGLPWASLGKYFLPFSTGPPTECTSKIVTVSVSCLATTGPMSSWLSQSCIRLWFWEHTRDAAELSVLIKGMQTLFIMKPGRLWVLSCSTSPIATGCPRSWWYLARRCWRITRQSTALTVAHDHHTSTLKILLKS